MGVSICLLSYQCRFWEFLSQTLFLLFRSPDHARFPDHPIFVTLCLYPLQPAPPPSPFSNFVANKSTYAKRRLGGPCVALGRRLGGPWVAQGPRNPNPNPSPNPNPKVPFAFLCGKDLLLADFRRCLG